MKHQQPASHHNQHYYHQETLVIGTMSFFNSATAIPATAVQFQRQQQQQLFQRNLRLRINPSMEHIFAEPPLSPPHLQEQFRSQKQLQEQRQQFIQQRVSAISTPVNWKWLGPILINPLVIIGLSSEIGASLLASDAPISLYGNILFRKNRSSRYFQLPVRNLLWSCNRHVPLNARCQIYQA